MSSNCVPMAGACHSLRDLAHDQKLAAALGDMVVAWVYAELSLMATKARILVQLAVRVSVATSISMPVDFVASVIVAIVALVIHYTHLSIPHVLSGFVVLLIGYLILVVGNLVPGI